jgi:hypothetical protein
VLDAMVAQAKALDEPALAREILAMYVREPRQVDHSAEPLIVAMVDYFSDAAERGAVRADIPPEEIAGVFLTALFGFAIGAVEDWDGRRADFERWIDIFVRGISP